MVHLPPAGVFPDHPPVHQGHAGLVVVLLGVMPFSLASSFHSSMVNPACPASTSRRYMTRWLVESSGSATRQAPSPAPGASKGTWLWWQPESGLSYFRQNFEQGCGYSF